LKSFEDAVVLNGELHDAGLGLLQQHGDVRHTIIIEKRKCLSGQLNNAPPFNPSTTTTTTYLIHVHNINHGPALPDGMPVDVQNPSLSEDVSIFAFI
jgi:hypothetical protein